MFFSKFVFEMIKLYVLKLGGGIQDPRKRRKIMAQLEQCGLDKDRGGQN